MSTPICPVCRRPLWGSYSQPAGKRICSLCGKRMRKHDKYSHGADGRPRHRDCERPTGAPEPKAESFAF
ncbi:MAG TPA: hypothetical protein VFW94_23860 [Candidatus Acidoferrales bacterium]|nr:hypothetical protein [Candidatus Acidoferrales bacterium]